jgi:hypothetical protein
MHEGGEASAAHALDAFALDDDLEALLLARCRRMCSHFSGKLSDSLQPEQRAALRSAILYLSTCNNEATPGLQLLGLRINSDRASNRTICIARSLLYSSLVVLLPWAWTRLSERGEDQIRCARLMRRLEACVALAAFLVAFRSAVSHRAATLPMALLGMQVVQALPLGPRRLGYEFMDQQVQRPTAQPLCGR